MSMFHFDPQIMYLWVSENINPSVIYININPSVIYIFLYLNTLLVESGIPIVILKPDPNVG